MNVLHEPTPWIVYELTELNPFLSSNKAVDIAWHGIQCFVWHKDQRVVCHCLAAILNLADDSDQDLSS